MINKIVEKVKSINYMYSANCTLILDNTNITIIYKGVTKSIKLDSAIGLDVLYEWLIEIYKKGDYNEAWHNPQHSTNS